MPDGLEEDRLRREQRREKIRQKKRRKLVAFGALVLVAVLVVTAAVLITRAIKKANYVPAVNIGPMPPSEDTTIASMPLVYDYSKPVPLSDGVGDERFGSALFIGDSRFAGLALYQVIPGATILADGNVNTDGILGRSFSVGGESLTLSDILKGRSFSDIYVNLGMNELGWLYPEVFFKDYGVLLDAIRAAQPTAAIYITAILPVSQAKHSSSEYVNNTRIGSYNASLQKLASERELYYLDLAPELCDANGYLLAESTTDGMNLTKAANAVWYQYIKTHTVTKENYEN